MKRFFLLAAMSLMTLAVSCSTDGNDDVNALLKLSSESVMSFPQEGGVGTILYTLANAREGAKVEAKCVSEWVTITEVGENVKFSVAINEESGARSAIIFISYQSQSVQVIIEQQGAPDVEFVASQLNGKFYGKENNSKAYQYTIVLSKYGTTGTTTHYPDDDYYHFNIYSSVPAASQPYLAWGEYVFDVEDSCEPGTFSDEHSEYVKTDADGKETHLKIKAGKIIVSDGMINALITLADDSVHRVLYVGDLALGFLGAVERGPFSTLEADYEFNIENCFLQLYYDGARYGADRGGWEIRFMNDLSFMSGDFLRFPVIVESLDTDINVLCRTFTADTTSSYAIGTFLTGYKFDYGLYGSWYFPVSGGGFGYYASAIADGTFVFELKGEDAVMTVDVVDDRGYKIKGKAYCPKNNISLYDSSNQR